MTDQPLPPQALPPGWHRSYCIRKCGLVCAAVLAAVALFFISQAVLLDFGGVALPGPGFFPLVLAGVLLICAICIGAELWREKPTGEKHDIGHRDVIVVLIALFFVAPAFERVGALLTLGAFTFVVLILVARMNAFIALASSAVGMAAVWYFFQILLGVPLPKGILLG